ncbi:hypothetical protein [Clostridium merdae]|uniref:hypothetical protein n=1 Tax=Clostridium merdae TaxID=1958780 RepID=UPI000A267FDF|nr:hypothetical protein [Clostridium merdae]
MPELWLPSGGVNRKQKELWLPQGSVNRKQKELWVASGSVNRKIFTSGVGYTISWRTVQNDWNLYVDDYGNLVMSVSQSNKNSIIAFQCAVDFTLETGITITKLIDLFSFNSCTVEKYYAESSMGLVYSSYQPTGLPYWNNNQIITRASFDKNFVLKSPNADKYDARYISIFISATLTSTSSHGSSFYFKCPALYFLNERINGTTGSLPIYQD